MEKWFERAMTLDDNCLAACNQKLDYLKARWHGSDEEALAFGRTCRETRNIASGIPLILATAHLDIYLMLPLVRRREYMQSEEVWNEIRGVYEDHLKRFPDDGAARSRYACCCWFGARYPEAAKQFRILGDHLVTDDIFTERTLKYARNESYNRTGPTPR
jgi:hypothetical protein